MNVFRRFAAEPAKMAAFYSEVLGLKQLPSLNMPGGGQMMLFQIGSGQVKLQYTAAALTERGCRITVLNETCGDRGLVRIEECEDA